MSQQIQIAFEFVEFMPQQLEEGVLYISMEYATATHKCCCGCAHLVVTPLSPTDWRLTFDGDSVSLNPSIGNWSFNCRSHYWIDRNLVRWAEQWSTERVQNARVAEQQQKDHYFEVQNLEVLDEEREVSTPESPIASNLWSRFKSWLFGSK